MALVLTIALVLSGCAPSAKEASNTSEPAVESETVSEKTNNTVSEPSEPVKNETETQEPGRITAESSENPEDLNFTGLNDPKLLQYVEDSVYSDLVAEFASEDYVIENVKATYVSKEYLEELAYNSQANIFFGYTLAELDAQFQGTRYVFTLGDNGETIVQPFESYDDTY